MEEIPNRGQPGTLVVAGAREVTGYRMKSAIGFSVGSLENQAENHPGNREIAVLASASPWTSAGVRHTITRNPLRVFKVAGRGTWNLKDHIIQHANFTRDKMNPERIGNLLRVPKSPAFEPFSSGEGWGLESGA